MTDDRLSIVARQWFEQTGQALSVGEVRDKLAGVVMAIRFLAAMRDVDLPADDTALLEQAAEAIRHEDQRHPA